MKNKLTKHDEKRLAHFLRQHRKDKALSLLQTKGFLFIVACCPDPLQLSEWLPLVLEDTVFSGDEEAREITEYIVALYNQMNSQILNSTAKLPKECRILPDTMNNFIDPAPIHQWAQGFMKGYSWLQESWNEIFEINEEAQYEFDTNVMVLGLTANRQAFEDAFADEMNEAERVKMAKTMLRIMPVAIKQFASTALVMRNSERFDSFEDDAVH